MNNQKLSKYGFLVTVFSIYWFFSLRYTGPAYLSDEIGYLIKAAAFAGYSLDMATSWHGGYSLLISPVFALFSDPHVVWQGILFLNALMWIASFALLFTFLNSIFPDKGYLSILATVAICVLYPAWITMSGYAFSTSGFVLVYMFALVLLIHSASSTICWILHSIMVGFLYWIHPTGLAVAFAFFVVNFILSLHIKKFTALVLHVLIVVAMITVYKLGVHPWLDQIMTPRQYAVNMHYPSISSVIDSLRSLRFWHMLFLVFLGQLSYLLIATFGLAAYAIVDWHHRIKCIKRELNLQRGNGFATAAISCAILSVLGIVVMGSISFSLSSSLRIDHWIYGRYSETVLLPVLAIGVLVPWKFRSTLSVAFILLIAGFALSFFTDETNMVQANNLINIPAFWPKIIIFEPEFFIWFIAGSLIIFAVYFLRKKYFMLIVLPVFFISINHQSLWHSRILNNYSNPTSLVKFIRGNFASGTCIGFNPEFPLGIIPERRQLYSYYFYDYDYKRMSPEEWKDTCDGPYLTHSVPLWDSDKVATIARGYTNYLFLTVKSKILGDIDFSLLDKDEYYIDLIGKSICLLAGCFEMSHKQLAEFSKIGQTTDTGLKSTRTSGYLFFGPYRRVESGEYYLELNIDVKNAGKVNLDIVSDKGRKKHIDIQVSDNFQFGNNTVRIPFSLHKAVTDIEVRLHVSEDSELAVKSYSLKHNDGNLEIPEICESPVCLQWVASSGRKIFTQVGRQTETFITTNHQKGYLLHGPYRPMAAGSYRLRLHGVASNSAGVWVDVVADSGRTVFSRFELLEPSGKDGLLLENDVILERDVADLEVRIFVEAESELRITSYELTPVQFSVE
jgi:hypothetical protein